MLNARTLINLSKHVENIIQSNSSLDEYGYMSIEDLIVDLNSHPLWEHIQPLDLKDIVNGSPIKRIEICGNKIRLVRNKFNISNVFKHKIIPPKTLYFGANIVGISRIKNFGIKPVREKYVRLYSDKKMVQVLVHKNNHIAYVEIDALKAYSEGVEFYKGNFNVYLAEYISPKYFKKIT